MVCAKKHGMRLARHLAIHGFGSIHHLRCEMVGKIRVWPRKLGRGFFLTRIASFADATWLCGTLRAAGYDAHDPVRHDRLDVPNAWRLYVSDLTSVDVLKACSEVEVVGDPQGTMANVTTEKAIGG